MAIGWGKGKELFYTHATALMALPNADGYTLIQNTEYPAGVWAEKKPANWDCLLDYVALSDVFDRYHAVQLYELHARELQPMEQAKIQRELDYVMTGKQSKEEIHNLEVEGLKQLNKKRKQKRKQFDSRKMRTLKKQYN